MSEEEKKQEIKDTWASLYNKSIRFFMYSTSLFKMGDHVFDEEKDKYTLHFTNKHFEDGQNIDEKIVLQRKDDKVLFANKEELFDVSLAEEIESIVEEENAKEKPSLEDKLKQEKIDKIQEYKNSVISKKEKELEKQSQALDLEKLYRDTFSNRFESLRSKEADGKPLDRKQMRELRYLYFADKYDESLEGKYKRYREDVRRDKIDEGRLFGWKIYIDLKTVNKNHINDYKKMLKNQSTRYREDGEVLIVEAREYDKVEAFAKDAINLLEIEDNKKNLYESKSVNFVRFIDSRVGINFNIDAFSTNEKKHSKVFEPSEDYGVIRGISTINTSNMEEKPSYNLLCKASDNKKVFTNHAMDVYDKDKHKVERKGLFSDFYNFAIIEAYSTHKLYSKYFGKSYYGADKEKFEMYFFGASLPKKWTKSRDNMDKIADLYIIDVEKDISKNENFVKLIDVFGALSADKDEKNNINNSSFVLKRNKGEYSL